MVASYGQVVSAPHLEVINDVLLDCVEEPGRRQMIFAPPRHGKSTSVSHYFPAWFLGSFPELRVILTSFEAEQARDFGRKARDVLDEFGPWVYGVKVRQISSAAHRWNLEVLNREGLWVPSRGGMNTAGVRGPLTGKGAHVLVIDDPVKDEAQASSKAYQNSNFQWYIATAFPRLEAGGSVVLMHTRWHERDLAGMLLAEEGTVEEGGLWNVLRLPALAEDDPRQPDPLGRAPGEALWPEMFPVPALLDRKRTLQNWFFAEYQQRPQPETGGTFKKKWLRYFYEDEQGYELFYYLEGSNDEVEPLEYHPSTPAAPRKFSANDCWCFVTVDLAVSTRDTADFTVVCVWLVTPDGDLLLERVIRRRMQGPDHLPLIWDVYNEYTKRGLAYIGIERTQYQLALIQAAQRDGLPVIELVPDKDKMARAMPAVSLMASGRFYLKAMAPYVPDFLDELLTFPSSAYDDQIDNLGYAAEQLMVSRAGEWRRGPNDPPAATNEGPFGPVDDPPFTEHFGRLE